MTAVKPKKIPMRMCLGCGKMKPKREMIRVVKTPDEQICLDATGKKAGRGAYICPQMKCLEQAQKSRRLEKNFSCKISAEVYAALAASMQETEENADA